MGRALALAQSGVMQNHRPTQVFIVDDSASIRLRLTQFLKSTAGVEVVGEAGSASEAIAGIVRSRPDSVLLDLNLMGSTGLDVMRKTRLAVPDTIFIVLTNHFEPQYREASFEAGARYFLDKSCDLHKVPDVIAEIAATRH
jgi:two-component system response regulator DevR